MTINKSSLYQRHVTRSVWAVVQAVRKVAIEINSQMNASHLEQFQDQGLVRSIEFAFLHDFGSFSREFGRHLHEQTREGQYKNFLRKSLSSNSLHASEASALSIDAELVAIEIDGLTSIFAERSREEAQRFARLERQLGVFRRHSDTVSVISPQRLAWSMWGAGTILKLGETARSSAVRLVSNSLAESMPGIYRAIESATIADALSCQHETNIHAEQSLMPTARLRCRHLNCTDASPCQTLEPF